MSNDKPKLPQLQEAEYVDILKQAISQIRTARILIAKQVNSTANSVY